MTGEIDETVRFVAGLFSRCGALGVCCFIRRRAQQSDAPPGSPAATRTIDGLQLPAPDEPFGGKIERNALQSTLFWQPRIAPPEGAPNVLLIMTDDVGFGAPSTFGGVIPTPALDRIAEMGCATPTCTRRRSARPRGRRC